MAEPPGGPPTPRSPPPDGDGGCVLPAHGHTDEQPRRAVAVEPGGEPQSATAAARGVQPGALEAAFDGVR